MDRHKIIIVILTGFMAVFLLSACQNTSDLNDEVLLTEKPILEAFEARNIFVEDITADLNIEIYSTVWEALEEHRESQIPGDLPGEGFYYRENETSFRFWVKNAIIRIQFDEMSQEYFRQPLNPMREAIFFDLNSMQETRLAGEKGDWIGRRSADG